MKKKKKMNKLPFLWLLFCYWYCTVSPLVLIFRHWSFNCDIQIHTEFQFVLITLNVWFMLLFFYHLNSWFFLNRGFLQINKNINIWWNTLYVSLIRWHHHHRLWTLHCQPTVTCLAPTASILKVATNTISTTQCSSYIHKAVHVTCELGCLSSLFEGWVHYSQVGLISVEKMKVLCRSIIDTQITLQ